MTHETSVSRDRLRIDPYPTVTTTPSSSSGLRGGQTNADLSIQLAEGTDIRPRFRAIADRNEATQRMFEEDVEQYQRTLDTNSLEVQEYRQMAKDCFNDQQRYAQELQLSELERKEIETRVTDEIDAKKNRAS